MRVNIEVRHLSSFAKTLFSLIGLLFFSLGLSQESAVLLCQPTSENSCYYDISILEIVNENNNFVQSIELFLPPSLEYWPAEIALEDLQIEVRLNTLNENLMCEEVFENHSEVLLEFQILVQDQDTSIDLPLAIRVSANFQGENLNAFGQNNPRLYIDGEDECRPLETITSTNEGEANVTGIRMTEFNSYSTLSYRKLTGNN